MGMKIMERQFRRLRALSIDFLDSIAKNPSLINEPSVSSLAETNGQRITRVLKDACIEVITAHVAMCAFQTCVHAEEGNLVEDIWD
jgi:hypothetical protein